MDKSEVRKWISDRIRFLRYRMQLQEWDLRFVYSHIEDDAKAEIDVGLVKQKQATITINVEEIDDEADLQQTVVHELCHLLHADFRLAHEQAWIACSDQVTKDMVDKAFDFGCERMVAATMRMIRHGLCRDLEWLCHPDNHAQEACGGDGSE